MDRIEMQEKLKKFNAMAMDDEKSQKIRDAIHRTMEPDCVIVAKASASLLSKVPEGPMFDLMLAATIEAAIAFLLVQGKIIIKEVK